MRLWHAVAAIALLGGGCVHSDVAVVDSERQQGTSGTTTPAMSQSTLLGHAVTTAEGNTVTAHGVDEVRLPDPDLSGMAADVEICAGADGDGAPVAASFFRAMLDDGGLRRPTDTADEAQLQPDRLEAGTCARGQVTFPLRHDEEVVAIVLLASTTVEWVLPERQ